MPVALIPGFSLASPARRWCSSSCAGGADFYIRHEQDGQSFELKIKGRIQFRYTGISRQSDNRNLVGKQWHDDRSGFEFERLRLSFTGHLWTKDLTYRIEVDGDTDGQHDVETQYAYVTYRFTDELHMRLGLYKAPFGRQETESVGRQQLVDRSVANEVFNLGRAVGAWLFGHLLNKELDWHVSISNGFGNPGDDIRDVDTNFAYIARLVWHAVGDYGKGEPDLEFHQQPALDVGLSFAYNDDNGDTGGPLLLYQVPDVIRAGRVGNGLSDTSGTDYYMFGTDASFKWRGFSAHAEYWVRAIDSDDWQSDWQRLSGHGNATHQQGGYIQLGYIIPKTKLEIVGRLGGVWDNDDDHCWEYGAGLNYYIKGHDLKLQADVTRVSEVPISASRSNLELNDEITMIRVQLQAAFQHPGRQGIRKLLECMQRHSGWGRAWSCVDPMGAPLHLWISRGLVAAFPLRLRWRNRVTRMWRLEPIPSLRERRSRT